MRAQDNPIVRTAIRLAAEGRGDSARVLVARELRRARAGDPAYVEALFWRGRLSTYGDSAERDFRRVALEYPTSPWADDALLELVQLAITAGNPSAALELGQRLREDYPGSDLRARTALWMARASFDVGEARSACVMLDSAGADAPGDVEFQNQVAFYRQRCSAATLAAPPRPASSDTAHPPAGARPTGATATAGGARAAFLVQVYAARSASEATSVVRRLGRAGLTARVERSADGYHRVRLGPFTTERQARDAAAAARRAVGGAPFVVKAP
jgi:cell division septation protein DedD